MIRLSKEEREGLLYAFIGLGVGVVGGAFLCLLKETLDFSTIAMGAVGGFVGAVFLILGDSHKLLRLILVTFFCGLCGQDIVKAGGDYFRGFIAKFNSIAAKKSAGELRGAPTSQLPRELQETVDRAARALAWSRDLGNPHLKEKIDMNLVETVATISQIRYKNPKEATVALGRLGIMAAHAENPAIWRASTSALEEISEDPKLREVRTTALVLIQDAKYPSDWRRRH